MRSDYGVVPGQRWWNDTIVVDLVVHDDLLVIDDLLFRWHGDDIADGRPCTIIVGRRRHPIRRTHSFFIHSAIQYLSPVNQICTAVSLLVSVTACHQSGPSSRLNTGKVFFSQLIQKINPPIKVFNKKSNYSFYFNYYCILFNHSLHYLDLIKWFISFQLLLYFY